MKKLIVVVVLALVGLLGYNYFTTGQITLVPGGSLSEAEQRIVDLEDEFADARKQIRQAYRSSSISGMDTTGDVEAAKRSIARTKKSLRELKKRLDTDSAKRRAKSLTNAIQEFERQL